MLPGGHSLSSLNPIVGEIPAENSSGVVVVRLYPSSDGLPRQARDRQASGGNYLRTKVVDMGPNFRTGFVVGGGKDLELFRL